MRWLGSGLEAGIIGKPYLGKIPPTRDRGTSCGLWVEGESTSGPIAFATFTPTFYTGVERTVVRTGRRRRSTTGQGWGAYLRNVRGRIG